MTREEEHSEESIRYIVARKKMEKATEDKMDEHM